MNMNVNQTRGRWSANWQPTIDVTPGAGWRRGMRRAGVALLLAVALPVLWFLGALTLLGLLGGVAVMLLWGLVRRAMPSRARYKRGDGGRGSGAADQH